MTYTNFESIPTVLTVNELMDVLRVGRNTAYDLVRSGQIKGIHIGKQIRILKDDLFEFLNGNSADTGKVCCTEDKFRCYNTSDSGQANRAVERRM